MLSVDNFKEFSWVPQDPKDQFKLALQLLNLSYSNNSASLENEICHLNGKVKELAAKLRDAEDQAAEAKMLLHDLSVRDEKLQAENEQLAAALRKLKVENTRLQSLASNIKSTIDANSCTDPLLDTSLEGRNPGDLSMAEAASTQAKSLSTCSRDKTSSRAQQVLAQIDISLNQSILDGKSPSAGRRANSAVRESRRTPCSASGIARRPLLPKSIANVATRFEYSKDPLKEVSGESMERYGKLESKEGSPRQGSQLEEGKAFFREARKLLPFDKFTSFMQQIKLLNKGQRTKEEVLKAAERLFGKENGRMLRSFKVLVSSNKHPHKFLNMK